MRPRGQLGQMHRPSAALLRRAVALAGAVVGVLVPSMLFAHAMLSSSNPCAPQLIRTATISNRTD